MARFSRPPMSWAGWKERRKGCGVPLQTLRRPLRGAPDVWQRAFAHFMGGEPIPVAAEGFEGTLRGGGGSEGRRVDGGI
jgi:hypothetical protein